MRVTIKPIEGLIDPSEIEELDSIVRDDKVVGYSVFDANGDGVEAEGISETAVAVFSNVCEQTAKIGAELGEEAPRPTIMFSGRDMELIALPLAQANLLVLKEKGAGIRREYRHAS